MQGRDTISYSSFPSWLCWWCSCALRRWPGPPKKGSEIMAVAAPETLEYTPTWVVAAVCTVIVVISLCVERLLHYLGKFLKHKEQKALYEALQKLKEELMLLGFISLLLTVFQNLISQICIPVSISSYMLPCKREEGPAPMQEVNHGKYFSLGNRRRLLSEGGGSDQCTGQGKVPLLTLEALHQLHIFIFVLAVVHVVFCAITMVLGGAKIRQWKHWEDSIQKENQEKSSPNLNRHHIHHDFVRERTMGFWRRSTIGSWMASFFKQFHASVTKSDYKALRHGFIMTHCRSIRHFNFHKYMMRALEDDFKKVVGISWYLWIFVVVFLLLDVDGWHTYFWLSFLPLILLLAVGTKLEHIITRLAQEIADEPIDPHGTTRVKPSDHRFWFRQPGIVLYLIHFILFQNSFEIAFFFWIWSTYGFDSCIMEGLGYLIPRLVIGVIIQVLCSYSTLPLYAIVTQMGDVYKRAIFNEHLQATLHGWADHVRKRKRTSGDFFRNIIGRKKKSSRPEIQMQSMASAANENYWDAIEQSAFEGIIDSESPV